MAEVLAVAASVVTILGLVKGCIEVYDTISEASRAGADLEQMIAQLRIQRLRFFLWCQDAKLIHGVLQLNVAQNKSQVDGSALWTDISPQMQNKFVLQEVEGIMRAFGQTLKESQSLIQKYFTTRPPSYLTQFRARMSNESSSSAIVASVYQDNQGSGAAARKPMGKREKFSWAMRDKKDLKALIELLEKYNDGLLEVLSSAQKVRHGRQMELLATTSPVENIILATLNAGHQGLLNDATQPRLLPASASAEQDVYQLINLRRRSNMIESSALEMRHSTTTDASSEASSGQALFEFRLVLGADEQVRRSRIFTLYDNKPVVLEWRYYSQRLPESVTDHLKRRVSLLSAQLAQSSRTTGFSILNTVGHYHDAERNRIAIVFAYPSGNEASKPVTLKQHLMQSHAEYSAPDQDQRFLTAATLALTFYRLHSVGWLHKSLRSDSILYFNPPDQDPHLLNKPYVCGFNFSRQDSPNELTENIPSVLVQQYNELENKIYRHPDLDPRLSEAIDHEDNDARQRVIAAAEQAASDFRYKRSYDIYSLGILLMEIGHWCPAVQLSRGQTKIVDFRNKLRSTYLPRLRDRMGKKYHDVVEMCLDGSFDNPRAAASAPDGSVEVSELRERREWLENFERKVVRVLEELAVAYQ